ncbi:uncharacterized protein N7515_003680 [Penicillium bovifimosum]|uniref:Uncharacterized protein n=1 Tax=Penicillium bovifimosum TaxID=126998 RepID=A0A9W9H549_9EURO|nr:uncharacterized protein N7515_003680 [Penicillium bovifimosum]KAJ5138832.1 hypothetical protein N7515_003680 [Penicillium bovifimosum]
MAPAAPWLWPTANAATATSRCHIWHVVAGTLASRTESGIPDRKPVFSDSANRAPPEAKRALRRRLVSSVSLRQRGR